MSNNIEEDIRIVEEYLKPRLNVKMNFSYETIRLNELQAMKNILNEYKKNQNIVDKMKEKKEELEDVLDMCKADNNIAKYKIKQLEEEIEDFKEILQEE